MNRSKKIFLSVLGNSKYYNETSYIFRDQESEDLPDLNPFDMDNRKKSGNYFGKLKQAQISKEYGINECQLFSLISKLADERNNFAHVFRTKEKIQLIEKRSKNIIAYMTEIKENIQDIARIYKLDENKEFFKNIIPNLETLE